ncbi:SH3 domain-containing protein [Mycolicibacterium psychrotolerans]|uniref:SH3 domain-containing protein n=1 Tax=Mycolicibacterium psychrotolerans TaxID=216929 RepID=UPI003D679E76
MNVRNDPSTNGPIIAYYPVGWTFNYDSWVIGNGYYWLSYISTSGVRRYVAEATLDNSTVYVSGGVFH